MMLDKIDYALSLGEKVYPSNGLIGWAIIAGSIIIFIFFRSRMEEVKEEISLERQRQRYMEGKRYWYEFW